MKIFVSPILFLLSALISRSTGFSVISSKKSISIDRAETMKRRSRDNSMNLPRMTEVTSTFLSSSSTTNTEEETQVNGDALLSPQAQAQTQPEPYWCYWSTAYELAQAGAVGIVTGLLVAAFKLSIEAVRDLCYEQDLLANTPSLMALIPAFGGVIVGLLILAGGSYPPGLRGTVQEVDQSLTPSIPQQLKLQANFLRKSVASVATLGTGASLGPEGPCVEIGINVARACSSFNRPVPSREVRSTNSTSTEFHLTFEPETTTTTNTTTAILPYNNTRLQKGWNRVLLSSGAAAGVAAGFNAPLAGVFFALEIMQNTFMAVDEETPENNYPTPLIQSFSSTTTITPILIASVVSALISKSLLGNELVLKVSQFELDTPLVELPLYFTLGALSGVVAFAFSYTAKICQQLFKGEWGIQPVRDTMKQIPQPIKPIIGGLLCGLVGLVFPQILFFGYETLNSLLKDSNALGMELIFSLLGVKLVMTAIAAGSGLVGGTFAPSLFLGAMLGALFHDGADAIVQGVQHVDLSITEWLWPSTAVAAAADAAAAAIVSGDASTTILPTMHIAGVPAYAMVGAASVLAALFRAPLTASLLLFEVTRNYDVILPLMASAGVGSIVGDILEDRFERSDEMQRRDRDPVSWGDLSFRGGQVVDQIRTTMAGVRQAATSTNTNGGTSIEDGEELLGYVESTDEND